MWEKLNNFLSTYLRMFLRMLLLILFALLSVWVSASEVPTSSSTNQSKQIMTDNSLILVVDSINSLLNIKKSTMSLRELLTTWRDSLNLQMLSLREQLTQSLNRIADISQQQMNLSTEFSKNLTELSQTKIDSNNLMNDLNNQNKALKVLVHNLQIMLAILIPIVCVISIALGVIGCYFAVKYMNDIGVIKL
jgi:hypothetical protein